MNKVRYCNRMTVILALDSSGVNELNSLEKEKEGMQYGSQSMAGTGGHV